jgi:hypothetical protein
MNQIKSILTAALLLTGATSYAQCSDVANNYEMKLTQKGNNTLAVQIRYNDGAVANAQSTLPKSDKSLFGLVFAIAWPTTSDIKIEGTTSTHKVFAVAQDASVGANTQNKATDDNIATFYHTNDMPAAFGADWKNGEWVTIAEVKYSGKLNGSDFFSFVNCDYGVAHPNSYYGNTHTDPWFAIYDTKTSSLEQFSPKMMTEVPGTASNVSDFNIYPNPTSDVFNVEISTELNTQVAVNITDLSGRVVKNGVFGVTKGTNKHTMNVADLSSGNYLIKITDGKTLNYIQKVQKN